MTGPEHARPLPTLRDVMLARVPPHSIEAEMAVLGSVLIAAAGDSTLDSFVARVIAMLEPGDFYHSSHQNLWRVLRDMAERSQPVDALLVFREVERRGLLDSTGGRDYIATLASAVTSPAHAEHYAEMVKEKAARRVAGRTFLEALGAVEDAAAPLDVVRARVTAWAASSHVSTAMRFMTADEVVESTPDSLPFLVDGILSARLVTGLVSEPKAGKSCLVAVLLRAMLRGGEPVLGRAARQIGAALWVTEEDTLTVGQTIRDYGLRGVPGLSLLPRDQIAGKNYHQILAAVRAERKRTNAEVVVFDTLARLAGLDPKAENDSGAMEGVIRPLQEIAAQGPAVLVLHHANKGEGKGFARVRGSSAFAGAVDAVFLLERRPGSTRSLEWLGGRGSGWIETLDYQRVEDIDALGRRYRLDAEAAAQAIDAARAADLERRVRVALRLDPGCSLRALKSEAKVNTETLKALVADGLGRWLRCEKGEGRGRQDKYFLLDEAARGVSASPLKGGGPRDTPSVPAPQGVSTVSGCASSPRDTPLETGLDGWLEMLSLAATSDREPTEVDERAALQTEGGARG